MLQIGGVYTALITPFTNDNEVDEAGLRRLVEFAEKGGVSGLVPCGTTGESATLSQEEHKKVIDVVVDASTVPVIAGTGSNNTQEAVEFTKHAEDAGAAGCLLITPYYNKPNVKGLKEHFARISDAVDIPLILYNIPSRTGQNINAETQIELAAEVPNLKGVKEASGDLKQVGTIIQMAKEQGLDFAVMAGDDFLTLPIMSLGGKGVISVASNIAPKEQGLDFAVMAGDDFLTLPIMSLGGKGVISVASNIAPKEMSSMVTAMSKNEVEKAQEINIKLYPLFDSMFLETNPIPVKKAAELMGLPAGNVRLPLGALSDANVEKLRTVLKGLGMVG